MRERLTEISFLLLLIATHVAAQPQRESVKSRPSIREVMTRGEVAELVDMATAHQYVIGRVVDFRVVDLDGDGQADLVALVDMSGRGHGRIFAVSDGTGGLRSSSIVEQRVESLDGVIRDLDGNGSREIVVPRGLTPYGGGYPPAEYPAIYVLTPEGLVDRSASFPSFYAGELQKLEQRIADLQSFDSEQDIAKRDALIVERDKILRLSGRDAMAGLTTAEQWASSPDPRRRIFAAVILGDIGAPRASAALQKLAADPDRDVAAAAAAQARKLAH